MRIQINSLYLFMIASFTVLFGCETVIDVELPPHEPRLVANGFFTQDSTWDVRVSESISYATDGRAPSVTDATVEIWRDNNLLYTLDNIGGGRYRSAQQPEPETAYTIRIAAPGLDGIEGTSLIPPAGAIESVSARFKGNQVSFESEIDFTVTIQDRPDSDDYYNIRVIAVGEREEAELEDGRNYAAWRDSSYTSIFTRDLALTEDPLETERLNFFNDAFFTDELFQGRSYDLKFSIFPVIVDKLPIDACRYYVQLLTVSEEFYFYQLTASQQRGTDQDPFSEPVDVYSNLTSGFGIFAGYHSQVVGVTVQQ